MRRQAQLAGRTEAGSGAGDIVPGVGGEAAGRAEAARAGGVARGERARVAVLFAKQRNTQCTAISRPVNGARRCNATTLQVPVAGWPVYLPGGQAVQLVEASPEK
jgi:hypothetical protein